MPVLTPSRASTEIVYAVRILSRLCGVISGISRRSSMSPGIGAQMTPELWRMVKAISWGVDLLAAKMRSPSFSRSSSSTTMTARPAAMSATASSTSSSRMPSWPVMTVLPGGARVRWCGSSVGAGRGAGGGAVGEQALDVLRHHVDLEVDHGAGAGGAQRGAGEGLGDERDGEGAGGVVERGDGEADPVDGDRALRRRRSGRGRRAGRSRRGPSARWASRLRTVPVRVDVALDDVAAEAGGRGDGALEVDPAALGAARRGRWRPAWRA